MLRSALITTKDYALPGLVTLNLSLENFINGQTFTLHSIGVLWKNTRPIRMLIIIGIIIIVSLSLAILTARQHNSPTSYEYSDIITLIIA